VGAGKYGRNHDLNSRSAAEQSIDPGDEGLIPRSRCASLHDPAAAQGYVGAALSSAMWRWHQPNGSWQADKVIQVEDRARGLAVPGAGPDHRPGGVDGRSLPVLLELAARRPRQYDISDPANPRLASQLWLAEYWASRTTPGAT
jgi:selenium-binding protein 1